MANTYLEPATSEVELYDPEYLDKKEVVIERLNNTKSDFIKLKAVVEQALNNAPEGEMVEIDLTSVSFTPHFREFLTKYFREKINLRDLGVRSTTIGIHNHDFHSPSIFNQFFQDNIDDIKEFYEEIFGRYEAVFDDTGKLERIVAQAGSKFAAMLTARIENSISYIENTLLPYVSDSEQLMSEASIREQLEHTGIRINFINEPIITVSDYSTYVNTLILNAAYKPELATKNIWYKQSEYFDNAGYTLYTILDDGYGTEENRETILKSWETYKAKLHQRFEEGFNSTEQLADNQSNAGLSLAYLIGQHVRRNLENIQKSALFDVANFDPNDDKQKQQFIDRLFNLFVEITEGIELEDPEDPEKIILAKGVGFLVKTS